MTSHTFPWADGSDMAFVPVALADQNVSFAQYEAGDYESPGEELNDFDVERLLRGDFSPLGLTADAGEPQTGAMIALLPSEDDVDRLEVPGGEPAGELHLTIAYLGEAAKIAPDMRDRLIEYVRDVARQLPIVDADGFAVSAFNQSNENDKEPCITLLVSGDELTRAKTMLSNVAVDVMHEQLPEQHDPWIPHVTLTYTVNAGVVKKLKDREGSIRFDHVRVAFGGEVTDIPLYDGTASNTAVPMPGDMVSDDGLAEIGVAAAGNKESDVNQKGGNHNLRDHWVHGPGALKIGWKTKGAMTRCIALLGEKGVENPGGLCAEYHHAATGEWPTKKGGVPSAVEIAAFEAEAMEAMAAAADTEVNLADELGEYDGGWEGPIVQEDTDTGDQRMFSGGSLHWADTETIIHPLQWAPQNLGEHKGSVTAGRIDTMWRHPENPRIIMGKGRFNLGDPDGLRAFRQVRDGFAGGISIDPDQITDADIELEFALGDDPNDMTAKPTKTVFHSGRLRGATLVAFPALVEASIKLTKKGESSAVVAAVTDEPWEGLQHEVRLGFEPTLDGLVAAGAFAYIRDIDDFVGRQNCRFLHHEIDENGQPGRASLTACAKHIEAMNTGRTFGLTDAEIRIAYDHMAQHFTEANRVPPALSLKTDAVVAAIAQSAPLEWFSDPKLSGPTPVTVTDDGRVFGHAACWGACHTGFADTCVTPPVENDYGYFTTGEVLTAEGHRVAVGQITLGTSHAATRGLSVSKAIDHYGDTGTAVADVTAGTDEHGIWIAGAVRPNVTSDHVHALRASALSGDWRRIGGNLRMVALLAVNVPGFPIPRVGTALAAGKQVSLVAAGVVDRSTMSFDDEIALLAGSCGIPGDAHNVKKYKTMAEELTALSAEVGLES
jgi:2'-5' RNA ligase